MTIATLIDKQDTVEIIRDQIAALLALETAAQVALATTAGKPDPTLWHFRVFQERANPWEVFPSNTSDTSPVVNVWFDTANFEMAASNIVERQKSVATINIDCYGYGKSADDGGPGFKSGDALAAAAVQRVVRLVRNILMAAEYTYLGLRGAVWRRWVQSIAMMQPQQDNTQVEHIFAARISFAVEFSEFSPQVQPVTLDLLTVDVRRTEDSQIVIEADYDYTV